VGRKQFTCGSGTQGSLCTVIVLEAARVFALSTLFPFGFCSLVLLLSDTEQGGTKEMAMPDHCKGK